MPKVTIPELSDEDKFAVRATHAAAKSFPNTDTLKARIAELEAALTKAACEADALSKALLLAGQGVAAIGVQSDIVRPMRAALKESRP